MQSWLSNMDVMEIYKPLGACSAEKRRCLSLALLYSTLNMLLLVERLSRR